MDQIIMYKIYKCSTQYSMARVVAVTRKIYLLSSYVLKRFKIFMSTLSVNISRLVT